MFAREYAWQTWIACDYLTHRTHDMDKQPAAAKRADKNKTTSE